MCKRKPKSWLKDLRSGVCVLGPWSSILDFRSWVLIHSAVAKKCETKLLQTMAGIKKCGRKQLQSETGIIKCDM